MTARSEKVKAGIFVLVSVTLLLLTIILIVGFDVFKTTRTYYVRFRESVTGLEESSVVRYSGVPVGRVSEIGFTGDDYRTIEVTIEIEPGTPIRTDTAAQLKPQGITGVYYIDLEGGTPGRPMLSAGGTIDAKTSVTAELLEMLADIKKVVENLNAVIEENRESIGAAVASIEAAAEAARAPIRTLDTTLNEARGLIADLRAGLGATIGDARAAIATARKSLDAVERLTAAPELVELPARLSAVLDRAVTVLDNANTLVVETTGTVRSADLNRVVEALEATLEQLGQTGKDVAETVAQVQVGVRENRGSLVRIAADFRAFSHTMKVLAAEIRQDPSRLLFGRRPSSRKEAR